MSGVQQLITRVGPLRLMLQVLAVIFVFLALAVGETVHYNGWKMLPTLIVPALIPIIFFGMLLELLMSTVFLIDAEEPEKKSRFKLIVKTDLLIVAGLILFWIPVFAKLLN
jgi:hypothetical protein